MSRRSLQGRSTDDVRQAIADEAARILEHQGNRDYALARRKAGARLGVTDVRLLPRNDEIDTALRTRQALFGSESRAEALRVRLEAAAGAMDFFRPFEPRLVGPVLEGTADANSPVTLHLFHDDELALLDQLETRGIRYEQGQKRVRYASGAESIVPTFGFAADDIRFELVLFERDGLREAPLDPIGEHPQRRAGRAEVLSLLVSRFCA